MGYNTRVTGRITIDPPIPWGVVSGSEFLPPHLGGGERNWGLRFVIREDTVDTDEGRSTKLSAVGVEAPKEPFKAYSIQEELQSVVTEFGEGHQFEGFLHCEGDEQGDVWRLMVEDGQVVKVTSRVVWDTPGGALPPEGLYNKYKVTRTDGSDRRGGKHEFCPHFVLDLAHDPAAVPALRAYCDAARDRRPELVAAIERDILAPVDGEGDS